MPARWVSWLMLAWMSCALACLARPARAEPHSVSYSTWIVSGDTVMLRFVLPAAAAQRLEGGAVQVLTVSRLGDYVLDHTAVSAAAHDCPAIDQGYDLGRVDPVEVGKGLYGFEILFRCREPLAPLVLEDRALFERSPGHVNFARIEVGRRFTEQLFTAAHERLHIPDPAAAPAAGIGQYARLGMLHVLHSADRLCFLVAVLLLVRGRREAAQILLGLAVGYGAALVVRASGLVVPDEPAFEAFVGFLIALCAVAIVAPASRRPAIAIAGWPLLLLALAVVAAALRAPRPALLLAGGAALSAGFLAAILRSAERPWIASLPAGVLGFLDGFALPSLLAPLRLPRGIEARMSIGYDIGALLAEAGVIALLAGTLALLATARAAPRRSMPEVLAAAVFGGLGTFWLLSRLY